MRFTAQINVKNQRTARADSPRARKRLYLRHRGQLTPKRLGIKASRREVELLSVDIAGDQLGQASGGGRGETHKRWCPLSRGGSGEWVIQGSGIRQFALLRRAVPV